MTEFALNVHTHKQRPWVILWISICGMEFTELSGICADLPASSISKSQCHDGIDSCVVNNDTKDLRYMRP